MIIFGAEENWNRDIFDDKSGTAAKHINSSNLMNEISLLRYEVT